jgi:transposase InsO family protein
MNTRNLRKAIAGRGQGAPHAGRTRRHAARPRIPAPAVPIISDAADRLITDDDRSNRRPTITFVMDAYTRMIVGYHIRT